MFTDRFRKTLMILVLLILILVWIIPVLGSGTNDELIGYWTGTHDNHPTELIFTQDGSGISGIIKVLDLNEEDEITDITFDGKQISFYRPFADERFTGIYQDGKLYGSYTWHGQTGSMWGVSPDLEKNKDYSIDYSDPSSNYDIVVDDSVLLTTWSGEHDKHPTELIFTKEGDALKGTIKVLDLKEEDELTDITFDGQTISFYRPFADEQFTGVYQDGKLYGTYTYQGQTGSTWSVKPKNDGSTLNINDNIDYVGENPSNGDDKKNNQGGIQYNPDLEFLFATWSGNHDGRPTELIFSHDGSKISGTIKVLDLKEEDELTDIIYDGKTISFYRPFADEQFTGILSQDGMKMSGTYTYQKNPGSTWEVEKLLTFVGGPGEDSGSSGGDQDSGDELVVPLYPEIGYIWTMNENVGWGVTLVREKNSDTFYATYVRNSGEIAYTRFKIKSVEFSSDKKRGNIELIREDLNCVYKGSFNLDTRMASLLSSNTVWSSDRRDVFVFLHPEEKVVDPEKTYVWTISDGYWAGTCIKSLDNEAFDVTYIGNNAEKVTDEFSLQIKDGQYQFSPNGEEYGYHLSRKSLPTRDLDAQFDDDKVTIRETDTSNGQVISNWFGLRCLGEGKSLCAYNPSPDERPDDRWPKSGQDNPENTDNIEESDYKEAMYPELGNIWTIANAYGWGMTLIRRPGTDTFECHWINMLTSSGDPRMDAQQGLYDAESVEDVLKITTVTPEGEWLHVSLFRVGTGETYEFVLNPETGRVDSVGITYYTETRGEEGFPVTLFQWNCDVGQLEMHGHARTIAGIYDYPPDAIWTAKINGWAGTLIRDENNPNQLSALWVPTPDHFDAQCGDNPKNLDLDTHEGGDTSDLVYDTYIITKEDPNNYELDRQTYQQHLNLKKRNTDAIAFGYDSINGQLMENSNNYPFVALTRFDRVS